MFVSIEKLSETHSQSGFDSAHELIKTGALFIANESYFLTRFLQT